MVPHDAQDAAEEAADEGAASGSLDITGQGAENAADDADAPEGPGQFVGAIAFVIPSTKLSCNRII